jgi:4-hydroxy-3-polyprenylbenzoate decarboxylase
MAYSGLISFINSLEKKNELQRIKAFVDPILEITEITDRVTKASGKALLFENNGTVFPVLINTFGSDRRMAMAIGRSNLDDAGTEIENLFSTLTDNGGSIFKKLSSLPSLLRLARILPSRLRRKGSCQEVVKMDPDLGILPILKCWPYDGGRFITLPMVHTVHPETGKTNVGMYRMQVLDKNTTGMHWQRHKTGANHFEAWKKCGRKMPVSVALGGDPVYTYAATAPLPENINEYILAGFLRGRKVKTVRCLTNELYVPADADIIIEGYVDPSEEPVWEGPFGDHTGFYSLADWYPKFHVTCITHSQKAVYPATIVGIPPQEDVWLAKATERIFLSAVKMAIQPEIVDFHMPDAGVAHNLVIVKINKTYPGQGMKVINSLFGAGQMMFSKYLIVVSGNIDIRNYRELATHIFENTDMGRDLLFTKGPMDVLDHSSDNFSFGGKVGADATIKHPEETNAGSGSETRKNIENSKFKTDSLECNLINNYNSDLCKSDIPVLFLTVNRTEDADILDKVKILLQNNDTHSVFKLVIALDHTVDIADIHTVAWQLLGNSDPQRDHEFLSPNSLFLDGTAKAFRKGGFSRKWPNVVCSDSETISAIDKKWDSMGLGRFIESPSIKYNLLLRTGKDEITISKS